MKLFDYQLDAVDRMKNGCILCGGVGSGKSRTALAYYYRLCGGQIDPLKRLPKSAKPLDLYIISTARKRDQLEWEGDMAPFYLSTDPKLNGYSNKVVVDSWNNIVKYKDIHNSFFIFDEQRLVGRGVWVKTFLKIVKTNQWILLSATPGDQWQDYIPVFIANGFYRNRTEFNEEHVVFSRFSKYPKIDRYIGITRLERLRDRILVDMDFRRQTVPHHEDVFVQYDISTYKKVMKTRWHIYEDRPLVNAAELCYLLRKIVNSDESRQTALLEIFEKHPKLIVFYNFDYELDILKSMYYGKGVEIAEWNGHKHQPIPTESEKWVYLVQYSAGCDGWNCIDTDTIAFYSQNYSYKTVLQAAGRIDRLNTKFIDLYYYHLRSRSGIDLAIAKALKEKKNFNERRFTKWK